MGDRRSDRRSDNTVEFNAVKAEHAERAIGDIKLRACRFWYSWRAQLAALQSEYEVAAIDMPGFNASEGPATRAGYLTGNLCKTIAAVIQALGRDSCCIVAHDWGGLLAFDFAALYPTMVERLAVLAAVPARMFGRNMDLGQMRRSWYMYAFAAPWLPELLIRRDDFATIDAMFTKPKAGGLAQGSMKDEEVRLYKNALARPGRLNAGFNYYRCAHVVALTALR